MLIAFEGGEGVGKSTHIKFISERLEEHGEIVVCTKEPGGTRLGDALANIVFHPNAKERISPITELLLMETARSHHVKSVIIPALQDEAIVLCDRFTLSTYAYQGSGRGISKELIKDLNRVATHGLEPDITILLSADISTVLKRIEERKVKTSFDLQDKSFHEKVMRGFQHYAANYDNVYTVKSDESISKVHEKIWRIIWHLHLCEEKGV